MKRLRKRNTKSSQIRALGAVVDRFARCIEERKLPAVGSETHRLAVALAMDSGMHTERELQVPKATNEGGEGV